MPTNIRQAENLTWQKRLYARELTTMSPIQLLIHAGANLGAKNGSRMTPLIHVMQKGENNQENIKALVCYSKQEEINEVDNEDRTALHHLAKMNTANNVFLTYLTKVLMIDLKKKGKSYNIVSASGRARSQSNLWRQKWVYPRGHCKKL